MRATIGLVSLLALAGQVAAAPPPGVPGIARAQTFISPMGEPFRSEAGEEAPDARWFKGADKDHDGKLTLLELRLDAMRFFATLDTNHDGEIDPAELDHYEQDIAPEVASTLSSSGVEEPDTQEAPDASAKDADGYPIVRAGRGPRRRGSREGAGLAYLDLAEPVASADRDMNRGISRREFDAAAQTRFRLLDTAPAGYLSYDRLKAMLHAR